MIPEAASAAHRDTTTMLAISYFQSSMLETVAEVVMVVVVVGVEIHTKVSKGMLQLLDNNTEHWMPPRHVHQRLTTFKLRLTRKCTLSSDRGNFKTVRHCYTMQVTCIRSTFAICFLLRKNAIQQKIHSPQQQLQQC